MHQPFTIAAIRTENDRAKSFMFRESLAAQPGQFVMAWLPGVDEKPFSIAGVEPLTLTIVSVGRFSAALHQLAVGDRVWLRGPLGQGFRLQGQRLLLAGGGYGVAPLLFLARRAVAQKCSVAVCIGARTASDVLLVGDLQALGVETHITTDDGSLGTRGLVTLATQTAIQDRRPDMVYACGPAPMLEAIDRQCEAYNLPRQLAWEAHVRCGLGLCGSCELDQTGWLVCRDGPVKFTAMG